MTMLLDERLRDLATQTHLLETKVSSLGWMAGADTQTLKSMTRAQAHLMLAEYDLLDAISQSEHSTDDVRFVGSRDEKLGIPWSQAEKVLDIDYDDGYGSQEIAADLVVAFTDGGFLRREEYDGSEWWEYEPPFRGPETQKPFGRVKRTYPAYSLEDILQSIANEEKELRGGR